MNFTQYLLQISAALQENQGDELATLLSPRESHSKAIVREFRNPTVCTSVVCTAHWP